MPTGVQHLSCEQEMANADDQYSDMQVLWFFQFTPAANHACNTMSYCPQVRSSADKSYTTGQPILHKMADNVVRN